MRLSPSILPAALALLVLPAALAAQTPGSTPTASRPVGCRGTTTQSSSITLQGGVVIPSYGTIESVQPGSPAERGGMRYGDVVLMQNGRDLVGNPPAQPALAGDTVQFVVWREGREVTLTLVLGAWDPPQEAPGVTRICRPVQPTSGRD